MESTLDPYLLFIANSFQHKNMLLQQYRSTQPYFISFHWYGDPRKQNEWDFATLKTELKTHGWKKHGRTWISSCSFYPSVGERRELGSVSRKAISYLLLYLTHLSHNIGIFAVPLKQPGYKNDALHSALKQQTCNLGS